jgi:hypothetical protein
MRQVNNAACSMQQAACSRHPKAEKYVILLEKLKRKFIYKINCKSTDNIKMNLTNQWITSVRSFKSSSSPTQ